MKTRQLVKISIVAAFCVSMIGCSHNIPVTPSANSIPKGNKIPAEIALVLSDRFKTYQHSENKFGDTWVYSNLGQASAEHFRNYLEARFQKVTAIDSASIDIALAGQSFSSIIEPKIESFVFDIPFTKFQVYPAAIRYTVSAYSPNKELIYTGTVNGVGDTSGSPGFDFSANPARSATKAVEEGVRLSVEALLNDPSFTKVIIERRTTSSQKEM